MEEKTRKNNAKVFAFLIFFLVIVVSVLSNKGTDKINKKLFNKYNSFRIISSTENKDLEGVLQKFAAENNIDIDIDYAGTIDIMDKLNSGEEYDAVWTSNSIWLYMLDNKIAVKESKSTSINPVVFGIKKSKAKELGFIDKDVYTKDILNAIQNGKLKFNMSSATQTNTGATAYLGFLTTLAGNPEVLKAEDIENETLKSKIIDIFSGVTRSSGSDEFLEEMFLNGDYEAVVTYETSIININKKLEASGKEPLYVVYAKDGVSISDSPLAYIDHSSDDKLETFKKIQSYILSDEGQKELLKTGRRVWYGGVNDNTDKNTFNPAWGIDTTKYLVPVKYPSTAVIKKALALYQSELRKPILTVFCLDYSGSMYGTGNKQLKDAMRFILTEEEAEKNLLQFSSKDKIVVIAFDDTILNTWKTDNGTETADLIKSIEKQSLGNQTNIYLAASKALEIVSKEDLTKYNASVILMTDGASNRGKLDDLRNTYRKIGKDVPVYSIMFGSASPNQLEDIAELTNAKVFDGRVNLLSAFKQVRGYN